MFTVVVLKRRRDRVGSNYLSANWFENLTKEDKKKKKKKSKRSERGEEQDEAHESLFGGL